MAPCGGGGCLAIQSQRDRPTKHKVQRGWFKSKRGFVSKMQDDDFASELSEIMKVATWLYTPLLEGL